MKYLGDVSKHLKCFQASARCSELGTLPAALFRHPVLTAAPPGSHSSLPPPQSPATDTLPTPPSWPKTQVFLSQPRVPTIPSSPGHIWKKQKTCSGPDSGDPAPRHKPRFRAHPRGSWGESLYLATFTQRSHHGLGEMCVSGLVECSPREGPRKIRFPG